MSRTRARGADVDVRLVRSIGAVEREEWDRLVGPEESPFLEWDWLAALEESGCVCAETGWVPFHLTARHGGELVGAVPLYLKGHSQGEFVFDHSWADAAERAGIRYYPKLLAAVPFTPAGGRRLLTHPQKPRPALIEMIATALQRVCVSNEISSLHVNFCASDEVEPLRRAGFLHRQGVQYHWRNHGYASFDDYLGALQGKRRREIRRERRSVRDSGVEIFVHEGEGIPDELFDPMFDIYTSTIDKLYWGRQYLNRELFRLLRERFKRHLVFTVARRGGEIVAGAFSVQKAGALYGRYWGCFEEIRHLHFEVCYYRGIEHCIERGLERFEPGAGGDYKYLRGFEPAVTHSMHFLRHEAFAQAVEDFLERERRYVDGVVDRLREEIPLRIE